MASKLDPSPEITTKVTKELITVNGIWVKLQASIFCEHHLSMTCSTNILTNALADVKKCSGPTAIDHILKRCFKSIGHDILQGSQRIDDTFLPRLGVAYGMIDAKRQTI